MPSELQKLVGVPAGLLTRALTFVVTMTTVVFSIGMTQPFADDRRVSPAKLTDLVARPTWREHEIRSGAVKRYLDSGSITNIVLVRAISNATPDLWFAEIRRALSEDCEFIADPHEGHSERFWLEAVLITKDGKHLLIQLANDTTARLTGDSFHGYYKYALNRPAP